MFVRPRLPNVPAGAAWNAEVSNHLLNVRLASAQFPTTFGRSRLTPVSELSRPKDTVNQAPLDTLRMPDSCQSPAITCAAFDAKCGLVTTNELLNTCLRS
jgi:hypothetical protein